MSWNGAETPGKEEGGADLSWVRRFSLDVKEASLWLLRIFSLAVVVGSACAFFLWSLDAVTDLRWAHPWLVYLLPVAGLGLGLIYHRFGRPAEAGTNLILDQIHLPGGGVPRRMVPLILLGTIYTHLFGGSAGREGTAVQMGGSIASGLNGFFGLQGAAFGAFLMAGVAAGFGAVFGTPLAGAVFAMEVLTRGRILHQGLLLCLGASVMADWTCQAWGIRHAVYRIHSHAPEAVGTLGLELALVLKVALAAAVFGLVSRGFAEVSHRLSAQFKIWIPYAPLRPVFGGVLLLGLLWVCGSPDYLGLGVASLDPNAVTLESFFEANRQFSAPWSWFWKLLFTVLTLSSGWKGGEVTPLFFIGAALGQSLSLVLGAPGDLLAALGFVAVFAGATKTPLASCLLGLELFGITHGLYLAEACFIAYLCSGPAGIYPAQRSA
jgi:H+/Cl- antiporter ClcA